MDAIDKKILMLLLKDSRQPISQVAREARVSREVAKYRIKRLQEDGIIAGFVTHIDAKKLGFSSAATFITIKRNKEEEFHQAIGRSDFTAWSGQFSGEWSLGTDIFGESTDEIHQNFLQLYEPFSEHIIDHRLRIYESTIHFPEKFLDEKPVMTLKKNAEHSVDSTDKRILSILSRDSRTPTVEIGSKVSLTAVAVAQRIKKLEKAGIIQKYSLHLDASKMGIYLYSVFAINKKVEQRKKLSKFLYEHPNVVFVAEYVGDPYIEFGIAVHNPYDLREVIQSIEEAFPDNRINEVFLIQKETLSVGPPACVFQTK